VQAVALPGGHGILHLKTGMTFLGDGVVLCDERLRPRLDLPKDVRVIPVAPVDGYAANCIRVNDAVVLPAGYPEVETLIRSALPGVRILALDLSEFRKMDGGPSCLSLRG
jgi:dimethylargininase